MNNQSSKTIHDLRYFIYLLVDRPDRQSIKKISPKVQALINTHKKRSQKKKNSKTLKQHINITSHHFCEKVVLVQLYRMV